MRSSGEGGHRSKRVQLRVLSTLSSVWCRLTLIFGVSHPKAQSSLFPVVDFTKDSPTDAMAPSLCPLPRLHLCLSRPLGAQVLHTASPPPLLPAFSDAAAVPAFSFLTVSHPRGLLYLSHPDRRCAPWWPWLNGCASQSVVRRETQPDSSLGKLAFSVRPRLPVTRPLAKWVLEWLLA